MALEFNIGLMEQFMKDSGKTGFKMEQDNKEKVIQFISTQVAG